MSEIREDRWLVSEDIEILKGRKCYKSVTCSVCHETASSVRADLLHRRVCACNRKVRGKPLHKGDKFGRLTVVCKEMSDEKNAYYRVLCDCGTEKVLQASQLRSGSTNSCGCIFAEKRGSARESHGMTNTKEYKTWASIINRTENPNESTRKWYFDKGIKMSPEWRLSFTTFFEDMGPCPDGYTIDRIDPDLDYCKENCRWASNELQAINKGLFSNNTSGKTGVSQLKSGKWQAYIYIDGKRKHLGTFNTFDAAVKARESGEIKYRSHIKE